MTEPVSGSAPEAGEAPPPSPLLTPPSCMNHPAVKAVYRCEECIMPVCATCTFTFPVDRRFCPACATAPRDALSPARRRKVNASLAIAIFGTIAMLACFWFAADEVDKETEMAIGVVFMFFCFIPTAIGFVLAVSSIEKGSVNPARLWAGLAWNGVVVALFLILAVVGAVQGE